MREVLEESLAVYATDPGRALELMEQAITLDPRPTSEDLPDRLELWQMRAAVFLKQGQPKEALECLERGLGSSPNDLALLQMQIRCLHDLQRLDQATQVCCHALEMHPDNTALWECLATLVPVEQSLEVLRQGYEASGSLELLHSLVKKLQVSFRHGEVVELLQAQAHPLDETLSEILEYSKRLLEGEQRYLVRARAEALLKEGGELARALELARSIDDWEICSQALEMMGDFTEAAHILAKVEPSQWDLRRQGQLLRKAGDIAGALGIYERFLESRASYEQHLLGEDYWRELDELARLNGGVTTAVFLHSCGNLIYLDPFSMEARCTQCQGNVTCLRTSHRARWPASLSPGVNAEFQVRYFWPLAERLTGEVDFDSLREPLASAILGSPIGKRVEERFLAETETVWGFFPEVEQKPAADFKDSLELRLQLLVTPDMVPDLAGCALVRLFGSPLGEEDLDQPRYLATLQLEPPKWSDQSVSLRQVEKYPLQLASRAQDRTDEDFTIAATTLLARRHQHPYFRQRWLSAPSFVGGTPIWMQNSIRKRCPQCKTAMKFLAQLSSDVYCDGSLRLESWPQPCLYLFFCPKDFSVSVVRQT